MVMEGLVITVEGGLKITRGFVHVAQIVVSEGKVGFEVDGGLEVMLGWGNLVDGVVGNAEVVVGGSRVGGEDEGSFVGPDGSWDLVGLIEEGAELVVSRAGSGIEFKSAV